MEQKNLSLDEETARKLKFISDISRTTQVNVVREFIDSLYSLVVNESANRIFTASYVYELSNGEKCVLTRVGKLYVGNTEPDNPIIKRLLRESKSKGEI